MGSTSSPRWLPTRGSRSHPSLWLMDVMEQTVEMAHVAIMVTTLSAVLTVTGVELLLMTALLLPKSSPRGLPTRGSRRHPSLWLMDVMEQTVEMARVAIMVTTPSAVLTVTGVELLLMTALLLPKSSP